MVFSDALSASQALEKINTDHPLLKQIRDMLQTIHVDQEEILCVCVGLNRHFDIRGTEAAIRA